MILYSKVTDAAEEFPITLQEAKAWCKVTGSAEDSLITGLIGTAVKLCEADSGLSFITQERTVKLDAFPLCQRIVLPYGPVQSVDTFSYVDEDGDTQTLVIDTDFYLDDHNDPASVSAVTSWPIADERVNSVTIVYTAGYGAAADVPDCIKTAILEQTASMYQHREDEETGQSHTIVWSSRRLLDSVRVDWYAKV